MYSLADVVEESLPGWRQKKNEKDEKKKRRRKKPRLAFLAGQLRNDLAGEGMNGYRRWGGAPTNDVNA